MSNFTIRAFKYQVVVDSQGNQEILRDTGEPVDASQLELPPFPNETPAERETFIPKAATYIAQKNSEQAHLIRAFGPGKYFIIEYILSTED